MQGADTTALGVPGDYYDRLLDVERAHWWHRGMRSISARLLGERLTRPGQAILDAGCGTGGFLEWLARVSSPSRLTGVDIGDRAIELAHGRVPDAELHVAALRDLPFDDASFDLLVSNDVLQHIPEADLAQSLRELGRVTTASGALLLRTNGARQAWAAREDWRVYDARSLRRALEDADLRCERVTYANTLASLWAQTRGHGPRPPTAHRHGIPAQGGRLAGSLGSVLLAAEAKYLATPPRSLPYGHTLFAVASPKGKADSEPARGLRR